MQIKIALKIKIIKKTCDNENIMKKKTTPLLLTFFLVYFSILIGLSIFIKVKLDKLPFENNQEEYFDNFPPNDDTYQLPPPDFDN